MSDFVVMLVLYHLYVWMKIKRKRFKDLNNGQTVPFSNIEGVTGILDNVRSEVMFCECGPDYYQEVLLGS